MDYNPYKWTYRPLLITGDFGAHLAVGWNFLRGVFSRNAQLPGIYPLVTTRWLDQLPIFNRVHTSSFKLFMFQPAMFVYQSVPCLFLNSKKFARKANFSGEKKSTSPSRVTPPKFNSSPLRNDAWTTILSVRDGIFSGTILNFQGLCHEVVFFPFLFKGSRSYRTMRHARH